jgi:hypothetical protein
VLIKYSRINITLEGEGKKFMSRFGIATFVTEPRTEIRTISEKQWCVGRFSGYGLCSPGINMKISVIALVE